MEVETEAQPCVTVRAVQFSSEDGRVPRERSNACRQRKRGHLRVGTALNLLCEGIPLPEARSRRGAVRRARDPALPTTRAFRVTLLALGSVALEDAGERVRSVVTECDVNSQRGLSPVGGWVRVEGLANNAGDDSKKSSDLDVDGEQATDEDAVADVGAEKRTGASSGLESALSPRTAKGGSCSRLARAREAANATARTNAARASSIRFLAEDALGGVVLSAGDVVEYTPMIHRRTGAVRAAGVLLAEPRKSPTSVGAPLRRGGASEPSRSTRAWRYHPLEGNLRLCALRGARPGRVFPLLTGAPRRRGAS